MKVRRFEDRDAEAMSALYARAVREVGSRHYTPAQVEAWASLTPSPERFRTSMNDGRVCLVAADEQDCAIGFCDLEADGHIDFLYCTPEAAGTGVAAALYETLEEIARGRRIERLYSEASEAAVRFFARRGFTTLHRRDFEVGDGVAIHNYAVEKRL